MQQIIDVLHNNENVFSEKFIKWLPNNLHIWKSFVDEAEKVRKKGFKKYSTRTLVCFLRHHSTLYEVGGTWKIDNDVSPYLARLYDLVYPEKSGMWEYRITKRAIKDHGDL